MRDATELLKNTVVLSYSMSCWGNRRKADTGKIQTDSDKTRLKLTKQLIRTERYDDILSFQGEVRRWLAARSVPSFFREALMLVKTDVVPEVEAYLKEAVDKQLVLVDRLIEVYPNCKTEAQAALNGLYRDEDYPSANKLRGLFDINWNWISLNVADNLPAEIRRAENEKLTMQWEDAIQEIIKSLREGFKELVDHAVDRLTVMPGEKPKIFRDSFVTNFNGFIDTFNARNVVDDGQLSKLVEQAKEIMAGVTADDLRSNSNLREYTAFKMSELKNQVDEAVVAAGRKFDFSDKV